MKGVIVRFFEKVLPGIILDLLETRSVFARSSAGKHVKLYRPYRIYDAQVGDYSYVARNSMINSTIIGKFCSIGPNFLSGKGMHPTNGLSTSPMFYSLGCQNGITLAKENRFDEMRPVEIGNDVFIGANVVVFNGVKIGDGAIVAAGAVVNKDVPPYSIVGGVPAKLIRKRFSDDCVVALRRIQWWNFSDARLCEVERFFDDVEGFCRKENG